jgi:cytochrome c biogenesis protein CcmG, thiol:disulfide interchange protein DsbE
MNKKIIPLVAITIVAILMVFLLKGLGRDPRLVPSPLVGKLVPKFELQNILNAEKITNEDLEGKPVLLNVWATWCPSCRDEHNVLLKIKETNKVAIYGINWKDNAEKAREWLKILGNPYRKTGDDSSGNAGMEFGVIGAPETFVIKGGIVVYKHTGPLTWEQWQTIILPKLDNTP